jgi:hypothetical protein
MVSTSGSSGIANYCLTSIRDTPCDASTALTTAARRMGTRKPSEFPGIDTLFVHPVPCNPDRHRLPPQASETPAQTLMIDEIDFPECRTSISPFDEKEMKRGLIPG